MYVVQNVIICWQIRVCYARCYIMRAVTYLLYKLLYYVGRYVSIVKDVILCWEICVYCARCYMLGQICVYCARCYIMPADMYLLCKMLCYAGELQSFGTDIYGQLYKCGSSLNI